jgi:hypothetical protein
MVFRQGLKGRIVMIHHQRRICTLAAALALLASSAAYGANTITASELHQVPGEKLDSGLGALPHYRDWAQLPGTQELAALPVTTGVPGEKLDSGLGALPHYRDWARSPATSKLVPLYISTGVAGERNDGRPAELPQYRADRR